LPEEHDNYDIAIIRGNASEIMSLSGVSMKTKGVDSTAQSDLAIESAQKLSTHFDVAVVVSGETDIIVDINNIRQFTYGSPLMPQITGTGCLLSAIVGAFHAMEKNRFDACVLATAFYGICGERAARSVEGPASFKIKFLDELNLIPEELSYERR
jgi:hydroxyethylthiazole kinase